MFNHVTEKEAWFREINGLRNDPIHSFIINLEDDISDSDSDESVDIESESEFGSLELT